MGFQGSRMGISASRNNKSDDEQFAKANHTIFSRCGFSENYLDLANFLFNLSIAYPLIGKHSNSGLIAHHCSKAEQWQDQYINVTHIVSIKAYWLVQHTKMLQKNDSPDLKTLKVIFRYQNPLSRVCIDFTRELCAQVMMSGFAGPAGKWDLSSNDAADVKSRFIVAKSVRKKTGNTKISVDSITALDELKQNALTKTASTLITRRMNAAKKIGAYHGKRLWSGWKTTNVHTLKVHETRTLGMELICRKPDQFTKWVAFMPKGIVGDKIFTYLERFSFQKSQEQKYFSIASNINVFVVE